MLKPGIVVCMLLGWLLYSAAARAAERPRRGRRGGNRTPQSHSAQYGAVAQVPAAADEPADVSAASTVVDLRRRLAASESLQDVLPEVPGVRLLASGAANQFVGLSLRGAEIGQATVLLGEVPLSGPDTGAFDLSFLHPSLLERIVVYRGGAPVWWSEGSIGGVLRLVPRRADRSTLGASAGGGSYGAWEAGAVANAVQKQVRSSVVVHSEGLRGDYPYLDDGGTRFDASDDVQRRRANNASVAGQGLGHLEADVAGGRLQLLALGATRQGGVAGPASSPALQAQRARLRSLGALAYVRQRRDRHGRPYRLQALLSGGYERNALTDRFAELGVGGPRAARDGIANANQRLAFTGAITSWLQWTLVESLRFDAYRPTDALAPATPANADRLTAATALEARLFGKVKGWRWQLRPSLRLQGSWAQQNTSASGVFGLGESDSVRSFAPTSRLGTSLAPRPWLEFSASVARGVRIPSLLELFGNRTTLLANPSLQPEASLGGDAGMTARGHIGPAAGSVELRGFCQRIEDLIRYRRTAQFNAIAENIAWGRICGIESGVRGQLGRHFDVALSLTWMQTRNDFGRDLPLRPPWQADLRPALHSGTWGRWRSAMAWLDDATVFLELNHTAANFVDAANLIELPARTWLGAGLRLDAWQRQLSLAFTARDLLDARGTDLLGFPLPGRRVAVSVSYQKEMP